MPVGGRPTVNHFAFIFSNSVEGCDMSHPYNTDNKQVARRGVACYGRFSSSRRFLHTPPASGFLEWINAFEKTACWRVRLKREIFRGNGAQPRGVANIFPKKT